MHKAQGTKHKAHRGLIPFLLLTCVCMLYAGTKVRWGRVIYPQTVEGQWYLLDQGSKVDTNEVFFAFAKSPIVPDTATMQIWYRSIDSTNDLDWVLFDEATFEEFGQPQLVPFDGAWTNNFMVFTTWTPGPVTHTNGVAVIEWSIIDTNKMEAVIRPDGTYFYIGDEKVAPNVDAASAASEGD